LKGVNEWQYKKIEDSVTLIKKSNTDIANMINTTLLAKFRMLCSVKSGDVCIDLELPATSDFIKKYFTTMAKILSSHPQTIILGKDITILTKFESIVAKALEKTLDHYSSEIIPKILDSKDMDSKLKEQKVMVTPRQTPKPSSSSKPSASTKPSSSSKPSVSSKPSTSTKPSASSKPSESKKPSSSSKPSASSKPSESKKPSESSKSVESKKEEYKKHAKELEKMLETEEMSDSESNSESDESIEVPIKKPKKKPF
ncbi:MAG: hypothetical protein KDK45_25255, partial [Leptospiraceae bacterium]|nr:hypothetical protein [Leptospiraceae bacterium]